MGIPSNKPRHITVRTASSERSVHISYSLFKKLENQPKCVSVSQSTSDRPVSRSVTLAGNCTALSMASSLTVKCQVTRPSEVEMTPSTPSSAKLELANTSPEPSSLIWSQLSSMRSVPELTVNFSTPNN